MIFKRIETRGIHGTRFATLIGTIIVVGCVPMILTSGSARADIAWGFRFTNGVDTVLGDFTTTGADVNLSGTGPVGFSVTRLNRVLLNGSPPPMEVPFDPDSGDGQTMKWDRSLQQVIALPEDGHLSWFSDAPPAVIRSQLSLSLTGGEFGSLLRDAVDLVPDIGPNLTVEIEPIRRQLLGISWHDGMLWDLDTTGLKSNPRPTGIENPVGVALSPDGSRLFGIGVDNDGSDHALYEINLATGLATLIGPTGITDGGQSAYEGDLDFDPVTGQLFGIGFPTGPGSTAPQALFTIDTATGVATILGEDDSGDHSAMAFDDGGTLYVLDSKTDDLLTLDKINGEVISRIPLTIDLPNLPNVGTVAGMEYDPFTHQLLVADGVTFGPPRFYSLDPSTGHLKAIRTTGFAPSEGFSGLAYNTSELFGEVYPLVIPEPSSVVMLAVIAMGLLRRRERSGAAAKRT